MKYRKKPVVIDAVSGVDRHAKLRHSDDRFLVAAVDDIIQAEFAGDELPPWIARRRAGRGPVAGSISIGATSVHIHREDGADALYRYSDQWLVYDLTTCSAYACGGRLLRAIFVFVEQGR